MIGSFPNPEKPMVFRPSPREVSLPGGSSCCHSWLMAGAMPRLRGSSHEPVPDDPHSLEMLPGCSE